MSELRNDLLVEEFKNCLKIVDSKQDFTLVSEEKSISEKVFEMSLKNSENSSKNVVFSSFQNKSESEACELGDRFYAQFLEDNLWYPGEVIEVYETTVLIRFDVYENEQECSVADMRPIDYDWEKDVVTEYILAPENEPAGEIFTDKLCENEAATEKKSIDADGNVVTVTKYGTHTKFENTDSESSFGSSSSGIKDYKKVSGVNEITSSVLKTDFTISMPPLPEINIPANNTELKALLAAWYTAGYYAAKYENSNK